MRAASTRRERPTCCPHGRRGRRRNRRRRRTGPSRRRTAPAGGIMKRSGWVASLSSPGMSAKTEPGMWPAAQSSCPKRPCSPAYRRLSAGERPCIRAHAGAQRRGVRRAIPLSRGSYRVLDHGLPLSCGLDPGAQLGGAAELFGVFEQMARINRHDVGDGAHSRDAFSRGRCRSRT